MSASIRHGIPHTCTCRRLLGLQRGDELHVRQQRAAYVFRGCVRVTCPRCGATTTIVTTTGVTP